MLRFAPNGKLLVSGDENGVIQVRHDLERYSQLGLHLLQAWDWLESKELFELNHNPGPITSLQFHPTEQILVSASRGAVKVQEQTRLPPLLLWSDPTRRFESQHADMGPGKARTAVELCRQRGRPGPGRRTEHRRHCSLRSTPAHAAGAFSHLSHLSFTLCLSLDS
jgi:hypothetical protein